MSTIHSETTFVARLEPRRYCRCFMSTVLHIEHCNHAYELWPERFVVVVGDQRERGPTRYPTMSSRHVRQVPPVSSRGGRQPRIQWNSGPRWDSAGRDGTGLYALIILWSQVRSLPGPPYRDSARFRSDDAPLMQAVVDPLTCPESGGSGAVGPEGLDERDASVDNRFAETASQLASDDPADNSADDWSDERYWYDTTEQACSRYRTGECSGRAARL